MKACTLISGSSGNATYVETAKTKVMIDAGQTGKKLTNALEERCGVNPGELDGILITHAHRDHIAGAGVLARRHELPIYATEGTWYEMDPLIGPVDEKLKNVIDVNKTWELGDIKIETFPLSHDALDPVGYVCSSEAKSIGIATDSGVFTKQMTKSLQDLDCLVIEANHDVDLLHKGPYPWVLKKRIASTLGHLSNECAGKALLDIMGDKTKNVILAHLSSENNRPSLALETVKDMLKENQMELNCEDVIVAPRYEPGPLICL